MTPTQPAQADFDRLYVEEYPALVRLAWTLTGRWAIAEELVQEAFLRAHQRWDTVGTYQRPGAWVRRVVLNLATSRARRRAVEARVLLRVAGRRQVDEPPPAADPELWKAVRALPRRQAQVVALYYVEDLTVTGIAEVLDVAEGTVRATLHQARSALVNRIGDRDTSSAAGGEEER
jgi:RNA polymerase sigma-70 factor, ECF subfamily